MVSSMSNAGSPHQIAGAFGDAQLPFVPVAVSTIASLRVAINRRVKNKIPLGDETGWLRAGRTFKNRELAPEDFIEEVSSGFAFCPWLGGYRHPSNFRCMQVLAVDVDSGPTIDDVLAHNFFQNYGWFIYTTLSHKPDAHRFRVVFLLARPIDTAERMKLAYSGIRLLLGGGLRSINAAHMFYGSEDCDLYRVGHVLPMEQLDYLIELGQAAMVCRAYIQTQWRNLNRQRLFHASDRRAIKRKMLDACYTYGD
ncbi:hypothetical protein [Burkholderia sp. WSM2230]|uniref:hypothetical protein n=1 Tax=Burkholderia sp. WSM2230 TaxID=944435 RepID=UPI000472E0C5|nr:hypothetical protein [Burkholderia sp. WSM2230]